MTQEWGGEVYCVWLNVDRIIWQSFKTLYVVENWHRSQTSKQHYHCHTEQDFWGFVTMTESREFAISSKSLTIISWNKTETPAYYKKEYTEKNTKKAIIYILNFIIQANSSFLDMLIIIWSIYNVNFILQNYISNIIYIQQCL